MSTETELQPAVRPSSVRRDSKRKGRYTITPVVHFQTVFKDVISHYSSKLLNFYIMKREIHLIRLLYLTFRLGVLI